MVAIPKPTATMEDIIAWDNAKKELTKAKALESALRKKVIEGYFPNAHVGTNKHPLAQGWELKFVRTLDRKVDAGVLAVLRANLEEKGIVVDNLVKMEPKLDGRAYSALSDANKLEFDQVLIIKDASPTLEIVLPAKAKAAQEAQAALANKDV